MSATDTVSIVPSVAGGIGRRRRRRRDARPALSHDEVEALQPASDHAGGRRRGTAAAQGRARAVRRRGRARIAGVALSGRGRRRHARARRLRRRSTSATCSGRFSTARRDVGRPQARGGGRAADGAQSRRARGHARDAAVVRERARHLHGLRRHRRRRRQFPDALSRQRRVRAARQAERVRQHLPLRRPGVGLRDEGRPVLSLPVSGAAAAGTRAELRRGRRARRAARASSARFRRPRRSS